MEFFCLNPFAFPLNIIQYFYYFSIFSIFQFYIPISYMKYNIKFLLGKFLNFSMYIYI